MIIIKKINGIDYFFIENNRFKTNTITLVFKEKVKKEDVSKRQVLPKLLIDKTKNYDTNLKLSRKCSSLYSSYLSISETIYADYSLLKFSVTYIQSKFLDKDITKDVVELLYEIVYNPYIIDEKFDEDRFNRLKNEMRNIIKRKETMFPYKTKEQAVCTLYENQHITSSLILEEKINSLDNKEIYKYYKNILKNNEMLLIFEGDKDISELNIFNTNNANKILFQRYVLESKELGLVFKKDKTKQNNLCFIYDGFNPETRIKNFFFAMLLGETPSSLLFQEVREKHSLAYSISSIYDPSYNIMYIQGGVKADSLDKTINLINEIFEKLKTENLDELIEETKISYINSINANLDSKNFFTARKIKAWFEDKYVELEESIKVINSITSEDIKVIANQIQNKIMYVLGGSYEEK